jgi:immunoglobulin-like protein involved in spore germination/sporulation and spore germination protein
MRGRRVIALALVAGILAGSGGAAEARSHHVVPHASTKVAVWFKRSARLWYTTRTLGRTTAVLHGAVRALIAGPSPLEATTGVKSSVPLTSRLRGISLVAGVATINLNHAFAKAAHRKSVRMRLAQLTFTATQFSTVHAVRLHIAGRAISSIAGVAVPDPMRRSNFARLLPAIIVRTPSINAVERHKVRVTGTSNVFEAAMVVKILDGTGHRIARKFFTASCGTGCRGHFAVSIRYHLATAQNGTVVVTDTSARGGRPPHIVRIPVKLLP